MLIKAFVLDNEVLVTAADTTDMLKEAARIHDLSPIAAAALGRTMTAGVMMAAQLKDEGKLTITIKGDGPLEGIVVCGDGKLNMKGYVGNPLVDLPPKNGKLDVGGAVGAGRLTVIRDYGTGEPYTGQVELVTGEIGDDFAYYYAVSQQQPTLLSLGVLVNKDGIACSGGVMAQPLPGCPETIITALEHKASDMAGISKLLLEQGLQGALKNIFDDIDILETRETQFVCDCSYDKVYGAIAGLGKDEIRDILDKEGFAHVNCQFCGKDYTIPENELKALLD